MFVINMPSHKIMLLFFFISFLYSATTQAQPSYTNISCSPDTFAANSSFQSDLTKFLSSLASNKTANNDFYNTTVHRGSNSVYGLFMCRGDLSRQWCHRCVVDATKNIRSLCNASREAVIWYEECMVRYSDRYFFSCVNTSATSCGANKINVTDNLPEFVNSFWTTMYKAADEAAKPGMGKKKFATEEASLQFQTVYCLVQCTHDLSPQGCRACLRDAIGDLYKCSDEKTGGRVLYPSCNVRYELFNFYNSTGKPASPPLPPIFPATHQGKTRTIVIAAASVGCAGLLFCLVYYLLRSLIKKRRRAELRQKYFGDESNTLEPLQFSLATIEAATNKFSQENCLGQGGFGQVYKGILSNGQEIAVKRLSKGSGQGAAEFKNEVLLIARLQHRSLVTLLGFCIEDQEKILIYEYAPNKSLDYFLFGSQENRRLTWEERYKIIRGVACGILYLKTAVKRLSKNSCQGLLELKNEVLLIAKLQHRNLVSVLGFCLEDEEKILVYEYVPNKSLDYVLFGSQKPKMLNWLERHKIIEGIARGILYLHEHSRLKVIHRDLKPSNILLDDEMNPKISDFGLARMVGINETRGSTNRIVGTLGYMSPEYIKLGLFSEKSDVFSFGVMALEIVSGKKNINSHCEYPESQYTDGLLSNAWKHWRDEKLIAILDPNLTEAGSLREMSKCIHIGLLCVQGNPEVRPSMNEVVQYLSNDSIQLPIPQKPAFFIHSQMEPVATTTEMEGQLANRNQYSINEMSKSALFPR